MTKETETNSESKEKVKNKPQKFPIEKLRENCTELFGVSSIVFDGAAYGLNGKYTVAEMKNIIAKWSKKEVK